MCTQDRIEEIYAKGIRTLSTISHSSTASAGNQKRKHSETIHSSNSTVEDDEVAEENDDDSSDSDNQSNSRNLQIFEGENEKLPSLPNIDDSSLLIRRKMRNGQFIPRPGRRNVSEVSGGLQGIRESVKTKSRSFSKQVSDFCLRIDEYNRRAGRKFDMNQIHTRGDTTEIDVRIQESLNELKELLKSRISLSSYKEDPSSTSMVALVSEDVFGSGRKYYHNVTSDGMHIVEDILETLFQA